MRLPCLIGSFGSDCAAEILFECDSVQRYLAPRSETRKNASANIKSGIGGASETEHKIAVIFDGESVTSPVNASNPQFGDPCHTLLSGNGSRSYIVGNAECFGVETNCYCYDARGNGDGDISPTMTGDHNNRVTDYSTLVVQNFPFQKGTRPHSALEAPTYKEAVIANTLNCFDVGESRVNELIVQSAGFHGQNSTTAAGVGMLEEQVPTLTTTKQVDVVYAIGNGQTAQMGLHDLTYALDCMHDEQAVIYTIDRAAFNQGENALYEPRISDDGINSTLVAKGPGAVAYKLYLTLKWIVRRLTPRECERLQGYPDDWTVLPKISAMSDKDYEFYKAIFLLDKAVRGVAVTKEPKESSLIRWYNGLDNDGARYRMLGNSLAIPCALRVIGYIANYERRNHNG
ncbi:MAG: DNA cytosine methyltransferase [Eubacterium sp.]|nr:DNA cytosine methyltransferase [Eubacterium sp.]